MGVITPVIRHVIFNQTQTLERPVGTIRDIRGSSSTWTIINVKGVKQLAELR